MPERARVGPFIVDANANASANIDLDLFGPQRRVAHVALLVDGRAPSLATPFTVVFDDRTTPGMNSARTVIAPPGFAADETIDVGVHRVSIQIVGEEKLFDFDGLDAVLVNRLAIDP